MKEVTLDEFQKDCLNILEAVNSSLEPMIVLKDGKPLAKIMPGVLADDIFGFMAGRGEIVGDIVAPVWEEKD
jgi:antitoxin (DNA-binding transcriptional repressor) of toxin-antitoxin stability system